MKAIVLREIGGPQNLHLEDVDMPLAKEGEVLVKVTRAAFNRRDVFITQGLYPGIVFPVIPGSDGCGTIAAHGDGVTSPPIGTKVIIDPMLGWGTDPKKWEPGSSLLGMPRAGTFAEYVTVPAENVYAKPERLTDDQAAALPLAGLTAYRAVFTRGKVTQDDVVLIPGIGGGVQTFALQFVKSVGAKAIVTSSSDAKLERARAMGADVTINYKTSENWSKEARAASGGGPTLIIDAVGGETFAKALDIARPGARAVIYGGTTGNANIRPFSVFWKHLDILGTSMGSPDDFRAMLAFFSGTAAEPAIDGVVELADVPAAAERMLNGDLFGKLIVRVAD